ncbi:hypothetical protein AB0J28_09520 [Streptosporangium canum]|uniref:hypothetical protein n=1 Tax=Streptosporangium canum TaxID=324952 RepID=UPI0034404E53
MRRLWRHYVARQPYTGRHAAPSEPLGPVADDAQTVTFPRLTSHPYPQEPTA